MNDPEMMGHQNYDTMRILAEQRGIRVAQLESRVAELTRCIRDIDIRLHALAIESYVDPEREAAEVA